MAHLALFLSDEASTSSGGLLVTGQPEKRCQVKSTSAVTLEILNMPLVTEAMQGVTVAS